MHHGLTLRNFKKFEDETSLNIDTFLTAIIGANESGKSSLLQALIKWNDRTPFIKEGSNPDITKNVNPSDSISIVECKFKLDDDDQAALSEIKGAKKTTHFAWGKTVSGHIFYTVVPKITRDLSNRTRVKQNISKAINNSRLDFVTRFNDDSEDDENYILDELQGILDSEEEELSKDNIEFLQNFSEKISQNIFDEDPKYLKNLPAEIKLLADFEAEKTPGLKICDILEDRLPKFRIFTEEERYLSGFYDINNQENIKDPAFQNFIALAGLDLSRLKNLLSKNDESGVDGTIELANRNLKEEFSVWSQSKDAFPRISINGNIISIHFGDVSIELLSISAESDGLRQFLTLLGFLKSSGDTKDTILLIDEIETHLHYDAQADYIQFLSNTSLVQKVIYTTHSAGCLPEDLGMGIKLITNTDGKKPRSKIKNKFWANSGDLGITPIIFGMGASTLAFLPLRNALICEGAVDHILLPMMIREAKSIEFIGFQIVPGISESSIERLAIGEIASSKTAYLLDNDTAEKALRQKLLNAHVPEKNIFSLPVKNTQIESYIDKNLYKKAVENCIRDKTSLNKIEIPVSVIKDYNRHFEVEKWASKNNIILPSKVDIASAITEVYRENNRILDAKKKSKVAKLFDQIFKLIGYKMI